ncbi:MAG TPA: SOS response-associated peptidase family protein [Opitutaceae bacterium]|nr:SOS response-associated peptidase family protein [Opitutaceae bacterium]
MARSRWESYHGDLRHYHHGALGAVRPIHDRMPAILAPADCPRWLDSRLVEPSELTPPRRPCPDGVLTATAVFSSVNNVRHDDPACLEPARGADAGDQPAQFTFGL